MNRILLLPLLLSACGQVGAPDVQVTDAWARATAEGQTSAAAYMSLANRGPRAERLLGVTAPPPATAMVHETADAAGVSSMQPINRAVVLEVGGVLDFKPLGKHIMISGLAQPLKKGTTLPLTLRFERAGDRRVDVQIVDPTSSGPR